MAPEVICKMDHSYAVDFFALGVIAYEFMIGKVFFSFILETLCRTKQKRNQVKNIGQTSSIRRNPSIWLVKRKRWFCQSIDPTQTWGQARLPWNRLSEEPSLVQKNWLGEVVWEKSGRTLFATFNWGGLQQLQGVHIRGYRNWKYGGV